VWSIALRYLVVHSLPKIMKWTQLRLEPFSWPISSLSKGWSDGIAFFYILHSFCTELDIFQIGGTTTTTPATVKDPKVALRKTMELAHKHLRMPLLIDNDDSITKVGVVCCLSYFMEYDIKNAKRASLIGLHLHKTRTIEEVPHLNGSPSSPRSNVSVVNTDIDLIRRVGEDCSEESKLSMDPEPALSAPAYSPRNSFRGSVDFTPASAVNRRARVSVKFTSADVAQLNTQLKGASSLKLPRELKVSDTLLSSPRESKSKEPSGSASKSPRERPIENQTPPVKLEDNYKIVTPAKQKGKMEKKEVIEEIKVKEIQQIEAIEAIEERQKEAKEVNNQSTSSKESDGKMEKPGQSEPSEEEVGQEKEKEKREPKKSEGKKKKNENGSPRVVKSPRKKGSKK